MRQLTYAFCMNLVNGCIVEAHQYLDPNIITYVFYRVIDRSGNSISFVLISCFKSCSRSNLIFRCLGLLLASVIKSEYRLFFGITTCLTESRVTWFISSSNFYESGF